MRILFINPPWILRNRKNLWRNVASIMPSLGLAWLAAVLEKDGHQVKILDAHAERLHLDVIPQWVAEHGPFQLVGLTATTPLIGNALDIARGLKSRFPSAQVVLGGVHPTVLPAEALAEPAVDLVVRGEGEETIREIAAEKPWHHIAGISYRQGGAVVHNPDRKLINDLDTLPFPAYHLLPMHRYRPAAGAAKRLPASSVLATRGCPGRCTFCYRIFGNRLRCRSGLNLAQEVKLLQDRYGIREICFYDDTFTAVRREVRAFCHAIQDMNLDLTWSCFSRVDTFDADTFRLMKETGCHQVMYGVETSNREILKNINKKVNPEAVAGVIRTTQEIGIDVRAAFMLGNPGETEETMEENCRYAIRLSPDLALFNICTPYPGTELFKWADENNYLITKNWEDYDLSQPVMELPTVSAAKVMEYYRKAHRRFLIRPSFIYSRLRRVHSLEDLSSIFRGIRTFLGI
jgi:anaerobic magnesium-protoporphyrin IX monomethyl ester cyclase